MLVIISTALMAQVPKQLEKQMPYEYGLLHTQMPPEMQQKMEHINQRREALQQHQKKAKSTSAKRTSANPAAKASSVGQWEKLSGLTGAGRIDKVFNHNGIFLAVSDTTLYRSTDLGNTWIEVNKPNGYTKFSLTGGDFNTHENLLLHNGRMYAYSGLSNKLAYYSDDMGLTWVLWQQLTPSGEIIFLDNKLFKGNNYSTNNGQTWIQFSLPQNTTLKGLAGGYYFSKSKWEGKGIYRSTDLQNWQLHTSGFTKDSSGRFFLADFIIVGNHLLVYDDEAHLLKRSSDFGQTWTTVAGIPNMSNYNFGIRDHFIENSIIYIVIEEGLFSSSDFGATWQSISNCKEYFTTIFKSGNSLFSSTFSSGLNRSEDVGQTWQAQNNQGLEPWLVGW
ncbi:MAG: WD40/YVTN/BNR-like repeat-containing protein, partial [Chryseotalea sp.]